MRAGGSLFLVFATLSGCSLLLPIDDDEYVDGARGGAGGASSGGDGSLGGAQTGGDGSDTGGRSEGGEGGVVQPAGPVHHYKFDDGAGTIVTDDGSESRPGAVFTTPVSPSWVSFGRFKGALELQDNQWIEFPASIVGAPPFTIALWIYPKKPEKRSVFDKQLQGGDTGFRLLLNSDPQVNVPEFLVGGQITSASVKGASSIPVDGWAHVAVTYETDTPTDAQDRIRIWVNGNLDRGVTQIFENSAQNTTTPVRIGVPFNGDLGGFIGVVDDLRIYDRALQEEEIAALVDE